LAAGNLFPIDLIPDGYIQVADYIQYILNQRECWDDYTKFASLSLPSDNINTLLTGSTRLQSDVLLTSVYFSAICEKYQLYHDPVELLNRHMDSGKSVEINKAYFLNSLPRRGPFSTILTVKHYIKHYFEGSLSSFIVQMSVNLVILSTNLPCAKNAFNSTQKIDKSE